MRGLIPHKTYDCAIELLRYNASWQMHLPPFPIETKSHAGLFAGGSAARVQRVPPCIDYQELNQIIIKYWYTLPQVTSALE